jgi:N utilization substance protein A
VRGSRIKNIVDELAGERIDIVRWNDSLQVLIPNALQPAQIEEVFLYPRLGRAIVLVKEDQLSLAIGRRGQNVRLASKLVGWDIEIMTHDELNEGIERAENWFRQIPGVTDELVETFIEEGFLSYDDLTFMETAQMAELAGIPEDQAESLIAFAEASALRVEEETKLAKAAEAEAAPGSTGGPEPSRSTAASRAAELFPQDDSPRREESKPTVESLFGPDAEEKSESTLSAAQVFGENSQPTPAEPKSSEEETK